MSTVFFAYCYSKNMGKKIYDQTFIEMLTYIHIPNMSIFITILE